jgi:hypothetical protein
MECFPTEDPALTGRCYQRRMALLSGPIKDQDLRVVAPVLGLSVPAAPARLAQLLEAAVKVAAREILEGVLSIFSRQDALRSALAEDGAGTLSEPAHSLGEFLRAATIVAACEFLRSVLEIFGRQALVDALAIAMVVAVAMVVVVVGLEQIIQEISGERCCQKCKWETHSCSPCC